MGSKIGWTVWTIGVVLGAAPGCGAEDEAGREVTFENEAKCLSCGALPEQEEQKTPEPAPRMIASPEAIAFYPDSMESPELLPKEVTITNATGHPVYVTHALVIDTREGLDGGGAAFFEVSPLPDAVLLAADESASVWVRFLGSTKQNSATLVVITTAPETTRLDVELTGKYFIDG